MVFLQLSQVIPWWITGQTEKVLREESLGTVGTDRRGTGVALFPPEYDGICVGIDQGIKSVQGIWADS